MTLQRVGPIDSETRREKVRNSGRILPSGRRIKGGIRSRKGAQLIIAQNLAGECLHWNVAWNCSFSHMPGNTNINDLAHFWGPSALSIELRFHSPPSFFLFFPLFLTKALDFLRVLTMSCVSSLAGSCLSTGDSCSGYYVLCLLGFSRFDGWSMDSRSIDYSRNCRPTRYFRKPRLIDH